MRADGDPADGGSDPLFSVDTLRQVFDASPSAMVLVAADGVLRLVNLQAGRLFGYAPGELVGRPADSLVPARLRPLDLPRPGEDFPGSVAPAAGEVRELVGLRSDGSEVPIEVGLSPIGTPAGVYVLAAIVDVSSRRCTEETLRASLLEKETLLREIHHRVKNNMQVVSSLLSLQTANVEDERYRALFEECQTRVRTMALIHEKLYSAGSLASLDGAEYLRDLVKMLARSYLPARSDVRIDLQVQPLVLDIHAAIPIGLIVHELVTNALKHAFRGERGGTLRIALGRRADGRHRLEVADDGPGLPPGFDAQRARGLGFRMVQNLVRQLDGALQVHSGRGSRFVVEFGPVAAEAHHGERVGRA